jgi:hypothetical protein
VKYALIPIAEELGIPKSKIARLKWSESQLVGMIIAEIRLVKAYDTANRRRLRKYLELENLARQGDLVDLIRSHRRGE